MKKIRFLLVTLVALLAGVSSVAAKTVYIQPGNWANDAAIISLNVWGDGSNEWVSLTEVETGILKATFADSKTTMAVVRGTTANQWKSDGAWNQTGDMTITDGKLYKLYDYDGNMDGIYVGHGVVEEDYTEPVAAGYKVDFNTAITTSDHAFQVASNWRHIVGTYEDYWGETSYPTYSYSADAGVDGSGALSCITNQSSNSLYDLLVTPVVKGTVTIDAKTTATYYTPQLTFYKITDNGDGTFTRGEQITVDVSAVNASSYTTITIPVDAAGERIGIRSSYVWLDNFTATEATIVAEPKITIVSAISADGNNNTSGQIKWEQQPNGKVLVSYTVIVTNTGDVDLVQGTDDYSISIFHRETGNVIGTIPVPQDLAVGETSSEFVVSSEVEPSLWPNSYTEVHMDLKENLFGSSIQRANSTYIAYEPKFIFREAGSTATSSISTAEAWGTIMTKTTKSFEIANTGTAPLTIKSVTLPDGFTSDNAPTGAEVILAKGETLSLNITNDASTQGTFTGDLMIVYLDKDNAEQTYTLAFSATVIGANTWTADFNNTTSTVILPEGSIKENGVTNDWDNKTADGKYNIYLKGYNANSYKTENNMFITPKLHANAGDKLAFDVKAGYSSSDEYFVKVYVSANRQNWGEPIQTYVYSTVGSSFTTKAISFDAAGDYYVAFALYGSSSAIDNLVGLEKVDVAHDLYIKSVSWPDASVKSGSTQSKPSVDIIPLTNEDAANYTVKYIYGENEVQIASKALTASASSTTTFAASFAPSVSATTTFPDTKVVFEFTDGTKFETETFDLTVTNEPIFHFVKTLPSSKYNEPTDHMTPISFGKTNTADTQTFYLYNWGSAPLTVNSVTLPEGFSTTATFPMTIAAMDENNLSASAQALDITFSATDAGTFSGNMVITYSGNQTFTLAVSGTKLDPNAWYANFDNASTNVCNWPAGSVYQSNVSGSTGSYSAPYNYYLSSTSTTNNLFITPKLTAVAGDKLLFDAKLYSSYWSEGAIKVYAATTRDEVLNAEAGTTRTQLFYASGEDTSADATITTDYQTFEVSVPAGEWYLGFEISNRPYIDEIYGLAVASVAHDLKIASSNIPTEGMQNNSFATSVNVLNLGLNDDAVTVTAYVNGEAVATSAAVTVPMSHKLSDAGTQASVSFVHPKAEKVPVYLEVKAGETVVATTDPVNVTFAEEIAVSDAIEIGSGSTKDNSYAPIDFYNFESARTSDIVYTAAQLTAFGLKAGDKITSLAFYGTVGYARSLNKLNLTAWVGMKTGDITWNSPDKTSMEEVVVFDNVSKSFTVNESVPIVINLTNPITFDGSSDLRIYLEGGGNSEYIQLKFAYDTNYKNMKWSNASSMKANPLLYVTLAAEPATLAGTVKTSAGVGIEGATVTLKADNGVQYSGTTAADGSYSFNVIQADLNFKATVEATDDYLKKQFAYSLGGESKTLDVTLFKQIGLVGTFPGFPAFDSEGSDLVMTQSADDPNIFTYEVKNVALDGTTYEYKLRADGKWATALADGYELPSSGNNNWGFGTKMYPAGTYNLTFTADMTKHELTLVPVLQLTLDNSMAKALDYVNAPADVTIGRTLKAGWNAIVLPFELDADEITAAFGTEAEVAKFDGDVVNGENVSITFTKSDVIEANVPYLLYLDAVPAAANLKFEGKAVTFAEAKVEGNAFDFVGIYQDGNVAAGDFIVADGKFYQANGGNGINAYRSYLQKKTTGVRAVNFYIDDEMVGEFSDTTTGINGIAAEKNADGLYNLSGQKVNNSSRKGVYIQNGKKVVVGRR